MRRLDPYFVAGLVSAILVGVLLVFVGPERIDFLGTQSDTEAGQLKKPELDTLLKRLDSLGVVYEYGEDDAPVRVVEIIDYQCPGCRVIYDSIHHLTDSLVQQGQLKHVYVNRPSTASRNGVVASVVVQCTRLVNLGDTKNIQAQLLERQDTWANVYDAEAAILKAVGLESRDGDGAAVRVCLESKGDSILRNVARAINLTTRYGIESTPMFFVDGQRRAPGDVVSIIKETYSEYSGS